MEDLKQFLESTTLQKLIQSKQKVTEVAYTATVAETLSVMRETCVSSVAVASPPAPDFHADVAPQSYVGIASSFDILSHFAKLLSKTKDPSIVAQPLFDTPIHLCIRGHTLSMLSPNISVLEAMDKMIGGMHRALVPHIVRHDGERTVCTVYSMITPTDIIRFLQAESEKFKPILARTVESLRAYQPRVLGLWGDIPLVDAIRCMHEASLTVVPILEVHENVTSKDITPAEGKVIVGSFSASDLKRCCPDALSKWAEEGLLSFLKRIIILEVSRCSVNAFEADFDVMYHADLMGSFLQFDHVSCTFEMSLHDVINMALENNIHRIWVIEKDFVLSGLICFIDIIRVVRRCIEKPEVCCGQC